MPSVMDRAKFERKQAKRGGFDNVEQFLEYNEVSPCNCAEPKCKGWKIRWKFGAERRRLAGGRKRSSGAGGTPGYIYFARLGDLIKVGFSKNPEARVHHLNADLLGACPGNRELEAELHSEFAELHERGEWFRAEPKLLERVEALCT